MNRSSVLALFLAVAACSSSHESAVAPTVVASGCTADFRPGIDLTTVDSLTAQPVLTAATVAAQDGQYADRVTSLPPHYYFAYERAGVYAVTVQVPGYQTWRRTLVVTSGVCHVNTLEVAAQLSR
jgi:hypothetical protein